MSRKLTRASSRAHASCPHCGHRAHGARGLEAHIAARHPEIPARLPPRQGTQKDGARKDSAP